MMKKDWRVNSLPGSGEKPTPSGVGWIAQLSKMPSLWTRSYFVSTTGNVSTETVKQYVESKKEILGVSIMLVDGKVLQFKQSEVYNYFEMFIEKKSLDSENTAKNYKSSIINFFEYLGSDIKRVTEDDLCNLSLESFDEYIIYLKKKEKLANSTIMNRVRAVQSFLKYLKADKIRNINTDYFSYITKLKDNSEEYGKLSVDEVYQMAELSRQEKDKGEIKYYLILFALDSCLRLSEILNLKWKDIKKNESGYYISLIGKGGKRHRKGISENFYNTLVENLKGKRTREDLIFDISKKGVDRLMKRLREQMKFEEDRNIVFHSIRKAGITHHYHITNDPLAAMKAGNHSSFDTTKKYTQEHDYGAIGAVSMADSVDVNILDSLSKEELLRVIKDSNKSIQLMLAKKAKEISKG